MIRKFIAAFALMFFVISSTAFAADKPELKFTPGEVYKATGEVYMGEANSYGSNIFDKTYARQIARMFALRYLAERICLVHIDLKEITDPGGEKHEIITSWFEHDSKAFKLITSHTRQVGEAKFTPIDGGFYCEVTMELIVPADWKE